MVRRCRRHYGWIVREAADRPPARRASAQRDFLAFDGGVVYDLGGILAVNDAAQVTGNVAGASGGGIYQFGGTLTLDGTSEVTGNTAGASGGGVYNFGILYACDTWTGAISPNTPDDPPSPTQVAASGSRVNARGRVARPAESFQAGGMLALKRNRLSGSQRRFTARSRANRSDPNASSTRCAVSSAGA